MTIGLSPRLRTSFTALVATVLAALSLVVLRPAPAHAADWWESSTAQWYDGGISYSQVINCPSMIFGNPYYEYGIGAFASYAADPTNARPAVGDTTFIRYSVYGMGVPCAGGTYFTPTFYLPAGMTWDQSRPISCSLYRNGQNNNVTAPVPGCPNWEKMSSVGGSTYKYWNNESGNDGSLWGVVQGQHWTFQFPVKVNQTLSGQPLDIQLTTADGNSNPTVLLRTPIYVFAGGGSGSTQPAMVMYEQPSTYDKAGKYGVESRFQAITNDKAGTGRYEIGTDPNLSNIIGTDAFSWAAGQYGYGIDVTTAWDPAQTQPQNTLPLLQPGVTYYWRGVITLTGQAPVYGAIQSFKLKAGGGVDTSGTLTPGGTTDPGAPSTGGDVGGGVLTPVPTTTPTPTGPTPTTPLAAPSVSASTPAKAKAKKGVKVQIACSAACAGKATLAVTKKQAKKLKLKSAVLGSAKVSGSGTVTVTVKLSKKALKAVKKAGKAKASVSVDVTIGGTPVSTSRAVTLKG